MTHSLHVPHVHVPTRILVILVVLTNVAGNYTLSRGMREVGRTVTVSPLPYLEAFLNPWVAAGVALMVLWTICQLSLLSWADLSYVLPVTSVSYALTAVLGKVLLHEYVSAARWAGIALITIGVLLVGRTVPRTVGVEP